MKIELCRGAAPLEDGRMGGEELGMAVIGYDLLQHEHNPDTQWCWHICLQLLVLIELPSFGSKFIKPMGSLGCVLPLPVVEKRDKPDEGSQGVSKYGRVQTHIMSEKTMSVPMVAHIDSMSSFQFIYFIRASCFCFPDECLANTGSK